MSTWTPGPWLKDSMGDCRGSDGSLVQVGGTGFGLGSTDPTATINGRLAVAAPEMAHLLQRARNWLGDTPHWLGDEIDSLLKRIKAEAP